MCTDVCCLNPLVLKTPKTGWLPLDPVQRGLLYKETRDDDKPKVFFYSVMYERHNIIADVLGLGSKVLRDILTWGNKIVRLGNDCL